ncbi:lutropin-choriogonadotropic hormone receptor-like [Exaiptasia diaphana]|uniref:G-protein coupled receptors family 1 profile domain-containing protein n=1 Tax=Exaiptasia diaphana TaxID=2652724 RepID=A0A913X7Q4_EXADI|nr:lutropin-choriogonadotropic hormone receptor-like [Exaiptasia diaphana]
MAAADVLNVVSLFGLKALPIIDRFIWAYIEMISGDKVCKVLSFFVNYSMLVSFITLVIITIERFRASRQTLHVSRPYTIKQRLAVVAGSWVISGALASYDTPFRTIEESFAGSYACKGSHKAPVVLIIAVFTILVVAYFFIIILSALTLKRLSHRHEIEANLSEFQRRARAKRISGAVKMVLSSLLLYTVCYVPVVFWSFIILFPNITIVENYHCFEFYVFDFLMAFLPLVNSCLGPGIYLIFLADFREAAKKVVCRCNSNAVGP